MNETRLVELKVLNQSQLTLWPETTKLWKKNNQLEYSPIT